MNTITREDKNKHSPVLRISTLFPMFIYITLFLGLESNNNSLGHNSVLWDYGSRLDYCH